MPRRRRALLHVLPNRPCARQDGSSRSCYSGSLLNLDVRMARRRQKRSSPASARPRSRRTNPGGNSSSGDLRRARTRPPQSPGSRGGSSRPRAPTHRRPPPRSQSSSANQFPCSFRPARLAEKHHCPLGPLRIDPQNIGFRDVSGLLYFGIDLPYLREVCLQRIAARPCRRRALRPQAPATRPHSALRQMGADMPDPLVKDFDMDYEGQRQGGVLAQDNKTPTRRSRCRAVPQRAPNSSRTSLAGKPAKPLIQLQSKLTRTSTFGETGDVQVYLLFRPCSVAEDVDRGCVFALPDRPPCSASP